MAFTLVCGGCTTQTQGSRDFSVSLVPDIAGPSAPAGADQQALAQWWRSFNDPMLDGLIEQGLASNPAVADAQAQYARAAKNAGSAGGLTGIFKNKERGVESASASLAAVHYREAEVRARLAQDIALGYIAVREQQQILASVKGRLNSQDDNREVAAYRRKAGLAPAYDAEMAQVQRAQTWATLGQMEAELQDRLVKLAQLVGMTPDDLLERIGLEGSIPIAEVLSGVEGADDLPLRRPDLREMERQLAAELIAAGISSDQVDMALAAQKSGSGETFPAELTSAITRYQRAVQDAAREVARSAQTLQSAKVQAETLGDAFQSAQAALKDAKLAYNTGYGDFTQIYAAEGALASIEQSLALSQADRASALVDYYTALGGGWDGSVPATGAVARGEARND
ncbi:hypothetical protein GRI39_05905 [Altererythrobacter indicus]|uniref:Efflux transporter outer membrane subunit n=1 Tax=Altericroceibacterium indicum TaxID=374177 RepID=A0A845AAK5_9SPHN|nr:TolC family protein [Altericroceibacterium indicum]MXP25576.1 hypothetical protein [Altericroceibacterium indicum]